jgi:predicted Rossmann fold nucleotide-binding protein DprA/Smf involved in DNA uptake
VRTIALSDDGQVIALACSSLAGPGGPKPLTPREWSGLARAIRGSDLGRPRALIGLDADELDAALGIGFDAAHRLHALLARGGQLAFELERLSSRGLWVITRADEDYPASLRRRLAEQAPPLLYGSGRRDLLAAPGLAVVGSRDADDEALRFARSLGSLAAAQGVALVSGSARGVDSTAMKAALEAGGQAVGFTVDPLERMVRRRELRVALEQGTLVLVTPFHPSARWHAANAMRRNRLIYAQAMAAVVVTTAAGRGGTWSGAVENLKHRWTPLWVRDDGTAGPRALIAEGARALVGTEEPLTMNLIALSAEEPTLLDQPDRSADLHPPRGEPESTAASAPIEASSDDLFPMVWPAIEPFMRQPRSAQELAAHFGLELGQARAWLKRGADDGLLEVKNRPRRFVSRAAVDQPQLFLAGQ